MGELIQCAGDELVQQLRWPRTVLEVPDFCAAFYEFLGCFSGRWGYSKGKPAQNTAYRIKFMMRKLLLFIESYLGGAQCWDAMLVSDLMKLTPDQNQHTLPLQTWTCKRIRESFGLGIAKEGSWEGGH